MPRPLKHGAVGAAVATGILLCVAGTAFAGGEDLNASSKAKSTGDTASAATFVSRNQQPLHHVPIKAGGGGQARRWICRFFNGVSPEVQAYYLDEDGAVRSINDAVTPKKGGGYDLVCTENGVEVYRSTVVYDPGNPAEMLGGDGDLAAAIDQALAQIRAAPPVLRTSPPLDRRQLVGVQTWYWIDGWADAGHESGVLGYRVSVAASPTALVIDPGDGSPVVTCTRETARAWVEGGPATSSCGHTYFRKGAYTATVTLRYDDVRWSVTDPAGNPFDGGTLAPITGQATAAITVGDAQAVIR
jgi:hypothetical protein